MSEVSGQAPAADCKTMNFRPRKQLLHDSFPTEPSTFRASWFQCVGCSRQVAGFEAPDKSELFEVTYLKIRIGFDKAARTVTVVRQRHWHESRRGDHQPARSQVRHQGVRPAHRRPEKGMPTLIGQLAWVSIRPSSLPPTRSPW